MTLWALSGLEGWWGETLGVGLARCVAVLPMASVSWPWQGAGRSAVCSQLGHEGERCGALLTQFLASVDLRRADEQWCS